VTSPVFTTAGVLRPFTYGRGYPTLNTALTPTGSGQPSVLQVPGNRRFRLTSVRATLTTSATAGNRVPFLALRDADDNQYVSMPVQTAVPASTAQVLQWTVGIPAAYSGADSSLVLPFPDVILERDHKARLSWSGAQAGDQLSAVVWYYDEIPVGPDGYANGPVDAPPPALAP
jgi:hypothetical protein